MHERLKEAKGKRRVRGPGSEGQGYGAVRPGTANFAAWLRRIATVLHEQSPPRRSR